MSVISLRATQILIKNYYGTDLTVLVSLVKKKEERINFIMTYGVNLCRVALVLAKLGQVVAPFLVRLSNVFLRPSKVI